MWVGFICIVGVSDVYVQGSAIAIRSVLIRFLLCPDDSTVSLYLPYVDLFAFLSFSIFFI